MKTIAFTSDNHFDVNRIENIDKIIDLQVATLDQLNVAHYLIAGDLFNDFDKSIEYVTKMRQRANFGVWFIAGNHDMLRNVSYEQLESTDYEGYLHNQFVDVLDTDYRIIGNNGWYDYSFSQETDKTPEQFAKWKRSYWIDQLIEQPMGDIQREAINLQQIKEQFSDAQNNHKRVIFFTHFVPSEAFIRYSGPERFLKMINPLLGSKHVQSLIDAYPVEHVIFGHIHNRMQPRQVNGALYYNSAVGYNRKKMNEWQSKSFMQEWLNQLGIIKI